MKRGIDVSSYQGVINWEEVKDQIDFAIIRCGYGANRTTQDDVYFKRNADECTRLGIPFGVYLYSYADTIEWSNSEVEHVLRLVEGYQMEYPIYYDIEDKVQANLSNEALTNIVVNFCEKLENRGYYVGVYANFNWWNTKLNASTLDQYAKWVARYNQVLGYDGAGMWQYTSSGSIRGINGNVDMDICYVDYPEAIKKNGLNGFPKPDVPDNGNGSDKTIEEQLKECQENSQKQIQTLNDKINLLEKENQALKEEKENQSILVFTCEKQGLYYLSLQENDKIFFESGEE
ncbi:MAG: glycoside hydrolase family 25 protein [Firmicutes bacterium]|nr:glycoside hydrolase family 25 protein [Bacillota bacterium]